MGSADVGKSTLLGVLTQGQLDNGRGRARLNMFRHLHEIQTGRTSSISHEILGFDSEGNSVDYSTCNTAEEICENATKLLTFIDLAGNLNEIEYHNIKIGRFIMINNLRNMKYEKSFTWLLKNLFE